MRLFRRIAGYLGLVKDDGHEAKDNDDDDCDGIVNGSGDFDGQQSHSRPNFQETGHPRKGFSVPVQVVVDRPQLGPVLLPSNSGDGGVQGLKWYAKSLRVDEDGDVADEFLDEVLPKTSSNAEDQHRAHPRFEAKYSTRAAKVKNQVITSDGKIQQCVEHRGRLLWV